MRTLSMSLVASVPLLLGGCASDPAPSDTDGATSTGMDESSTSSSSTAADSSSSGNAACLELTVDLGDAPCVQFGENELADFMEEDCGPVSCTPRTGPEDGRFPLGLSVDSDCNFQGLISEDRIGGWAQIVDVERDGQTVSVPFCAVQESTPAGYSVEFTPSPIAAQTFDPAGPIAFADEPTLRVQPAQDCPADDCSFSWAFSALSGGFDPLVSLGGALEDNGGSATLVQPLVATADEVDPEFTTRPWVFSLDVNYCMQAGNACAKINPNTDAMDAFAAFALVMTPQYE